MDFQQQPQSETQTEQNPERNQQMPEVPAPNPVPNQKDVPASTPTPQQQPNQEPGGMNRQQPYGTGNGGQIPYQNQYPYGRNPYQYNNNPNGYPNMDPYYNRNTYQLPYKEPGSSLANAAMVLGILAILSSITFTMYPPFIFGSIAIVLALLSKGRRPKLFPKAKTGIICAVIGLAVNLLVVTSTMYLVFTNQEVRDEVNEVFERQYGITFDEALEEIMEENGFSY